MTAKGKKNSLWILWVLFAAGGAFVLNTWYGILESLECGDLELLKESALDMLMILWGSLIIIFGLLVSYIADGLLDD